MGLAARAANRGMKVTSNTSATIASVTTMRLSIRCGDTRIAGEGSDDDSEGVGVVRILKATHPFKTDGVLSLVVVTKRAT